MKINLIKYFILVLILAVLTVNVVNIFKADHLFTLKLNASSLSQGKSYYSRLNLWYYFAVNQEWSTASTLESHLSSADLLVFKRLYEPIYLQRRAQTISQKQEQTIEDWIELSKVYANLNQKQNAIDALVSARRLDPLRVDLEKIEIEIKK